MEDVNIDNNNISMSAFTLKMIAIFAMLIDHIAWAFVPTGTPLGQVMHAIGRITAPIMCYFIAEGYYRTSNIKKYALRLGIFAIISHIPFNYFMRGTLEFKLQTSVIYTLFLGLISLIIWNKENINKSLKVILIFIICILATPGDWSFIAVLWILFFGINHNDFKKQISSFCSISLPLVIMPFIMLISNDSNWYSQLFLIGVFLPIPLLKRYNGKSGSTKYSKWIFYIFYPLHLLIIGLIKYGVSF